MYVSTHLTNPGNPGGVEPTSTWHNLDRHGQPLEIIDRPADAQPDHGDPNTPWYQAVEHIHRWEENRVTGIHARGTVEELRKLLDRILRVEEEVVRAFPKGSDPALVDVLAVVEGAEMRLTAGVRPIPEWMQARRRRVAEALRQADRDAAPLFGYLWSDEPDE